MKKIIRYPLTCLSLALLSLTACQIEQPVPVVPAVAPSASNLRKGGPAEASPQSYIVLFDQSHPDIAEEPKAKTERPFPGSHSQGNGPTKARGLAERVMGNHNFPKEKIQRVFDLVGSKGFKIKATETEINELNNDPTIKHIEEDRVVALSLTPNAKGRLVPSDDGPANQALTYGVQRVGGFKDMSKSRKFAWIVDSGIDMDHEDLNVKSGWAMDFSGSAGSSWTVEDSFGHGTHVAGIIGAMDNGIGVVGVAAGVQLIPVKVLNAQGEGTVSGLIDALNYIGWYANKGDVVNLSVGTDKSLALESAITALKDNYSVKIVVSAGNDGVDTNPFSPASMAEYNVYVAGAIDENDAFCSFSNFGNNVDYVLPGANIYSTFINNQYTSLSGTSMAAPHLAGLLLIEGINGDYKIKNNGSVTLPNGSIANIPKWWVD